MSPREIAHRVYRFGEFALDLDRETLYRGERKIHLRPKSLAVLRILLDNQGRLVTKAQLHDAAWKTSVVTDDSLAHCIADIRQTLGRNGFDIIQTVPRRGYIFDQTVSYELVSPPQTVGLYRRPAFRLSAIATVLVALSVLWAGHGGSDYVDADAAARPAVNVPRDDLPGTSIAADNEIEKGQFFFKRRAAGDLDLAEASFKAALELDPTLAPGWIGLSGVYSVNIGMGYLSPEDAVPLLGDATHHAVTLAPENAEAHLRRAFYHDLVGEPQVARQHVETAVAIAPNDVLVLGMIAGQLAHNQRFDEAIELQRRAVQGDPTSALQRHNLVWYMLAGSRTAEAAVEAEQYRALNPRGVGEGNDLFVEVMILQGNYEQALTQGRAMPSGPVRDRNLAMIHHALRQEAKADAALTRLLAADDARFYAAEVYALRGDGEAAIQQLHRAWIARETGTAANSHWDATLLLSPFLISLRDDERWQILYAQALLSREDPFAVAWASGRERSFRK